MHANEFNEYYAGASRSLIAFGGFGKVYKVSAPNDPHKIIAMKVVNIREIVTRYTRGSSITESPTVKDAVIESVLNEAVIMRKLNHDNIVKIIDSYIEKDGTTESFNRLYLMMEYSPYGSLHRFIKSKTNLKSELCLCLPELVVSGITSQLLQALKYLADEGIIHGDVKSPNVLIFPNGIVKLCDFGLSFRWDDDNKDDYDDAVPMFIEEEKNKRRLQKIAVNGSAYWLAPEIILHKMATPKSDIWSLGATVIEMLTGKPPFGDLGALQACHKVGSGCKIIYPVNISEACRSFLDSCFEMKPMLRPRAKTLIKSSWIKNSNVHALVGVDGLYDRDFVDDLVESEEYFGELKLDRLKELNLGYKKRTKLEEFKEKAADDNYDDLELEIPEDTNFRTKGLLQLQAIATVHDQRRFLQLDVHFFQDMLSALENHEFKRCEELLRIGVDYLRNRPAVLTELCLKGLLVEFAVAKRNGLPADGGVEMLRATVLDTLQSRGREWLCVTGLM